MQNPFTTTFSKVPDDTYISIEQLDEIINNFSYDNPSESVYKITGVRGSGKTVLLAKVAKELADMTKGYAYAFQELGVLCFNKKYKNAEMAEGDLKMELYSYAYEKIWEEMAEGDRELVCLLTEKEELKRKDIISKMKKPQNYSVYRDRLMRRGVVKVRQGYIGLILPYFGEFIREYHM